MSCAWIFFLSDSVTLSGETGFPTTYHRALGPGPHTFSETPDSWAGTWGAVCAWRAQGPCSQPTRWPVPALAFRTSLLCAGSKLALGLLSSLTYLEPCPVGSCPYVKCGVLFIRNSPQVGLWQTGERGSCPFPAQRSPPQEGVYGPRLSQASLLETI